MKTHRDRRGRHCKNFDWRTNDSTWQAERANDKIVFRKILALVRKHGWHPRKAILLMLRNEFWTERMNRTLLEALQEARVLARGEARAEAPEVFEHPPEYELGHPARGEHGLENLLADGQAIAHNVQICTYSAINYR